MKVLTRRRFVAAAALATGALALGFHLRVRRREERFDPGPQVAGEINAWLVISPDDRVLVRVTKGEMGQGVLTSLAMIVAEELECRWEDVRVEAADVNRSLQNKRYYGSFRTDGSAAVRGSRRLLQQVGAHARQRLIAAAASRWGVQPNECLARDGRVTHPPSARSFRFGELVFEAASIDVSLNKKEIKSPAQYRLLGRPTARLDVPLKVNGEATYGIDVRVPGMLHAAVAHSPVLGGTVRGITVGDTVSNGNSVFALEDAVVAVAPTYWQARSTLDRVEADWQSGPARGIATDAIRTQCIGALAEPGNIAANRGDAGARLAPHGDAVFEATYDVPYLAHACMEPMNCTAAISGDRVDVWVGTQDPEAVVELARTMLGREPGQIHVHPQWMGGGFGRRVSTDHVAEALRIALRVGAPVQVMWTREQDMRRGQYRPMAACRLRASLEPGSPSALEIRSVADSIFMKHRAHDVKDGIDPTSTMGLADMPYAWDHLRVESRNLSSSIPTWYWRSVGDSQNAFALESFIDELAARIGTDAFALRRRLLRDQPRHLAVLDALEQKVDPQQKLPRGQGRGIALHRNSNTVVAQAIDVDVTPGGAVAVRRVIAVVDCGHVINPRTVEHQVEGAVVFALTAALYGEITIEAGQVLHGNFDSYRLMTMRDCPAIETHLALSGGDTWGGIGEPGVPPVAPALCNAICAATGKRIRSLPVAKHDLSWSNH